ncbi:nuclease [Peteryoungia desertarenae]|nr:nuclease [Peteryoungia desertarenae]
MARNNARRAPARRRKTQRRTRGNGRSGAAGLTPWLLVLLVVVGGIALYDNRVSAWRTVSPYLSSGGSSPQVASAPPKEKRDTAVATKPETAPPRLGPIPPERVPETAGAPLPVVKPTVDVIGQQSVAASTADRATIGEGLSGRFYFCGTSGLDNCVAEGDTFWYRSTRITLADVITPRTEGADCQQERDLGFKAKVRLKDLLNEGRFNLQELRDQADAAQSTAVHRVVTRDGRSLGSILVSEGLAKPRASRQQGWCS